MPRPRGFSRQARAPRRLTAWTGGPQSATDGLAVQFTATSAVLGVSVAPNIEGLTIIRIRGEVQAFLESANAAAAGYSCAVGMAVVTLAAFTAGVASVPSPITEDQWDGWLYHKFFSCFAGGTIDGGVTADHDLVNSRVSATRFEIDSKAMRKFPIQTVLIFVMEVVETGTAVLRIGMNSRVLFKLP